MLRLRRLFACLSFILAVQGAAMAAWETTNGNSQHNGRSRYYGPLAEETLWSEPTAPAWFGGPIFTGDGVLVTMRFNGLNDTPLLCHDQRTGEELWRLAFPGNNCRALPIGFRDHQIYAIGFRESQHDTLYAVNPADGSIIWRSPQPVFTGIVFSAVFADNGDLIVPGDDFELVRINHVTGARLWGAERILPVIGGSEHLAVYGGKVYGWQGSIVTPKELTAWDIETGAELYSLALPGDGDQEIPLTIGPDGTLYAQRDGGLFYAIRDTGTELEILWSLTVGGVPYMGHPGVSVDGSVLVADGTELVRLDPATGAELDRSDPLVTNSVLNPRFAIGADSIIYVSNSGFADGAFYALSPTLETLWSVPVPSITYSGPAFSDSGDITISGSGSTIMVFAGRGAAEPPTSEFHLLRPDSGATMAGDSITFVWQAFRAPDGSEVHYDVAFYPWHSGQPDPFLIENLTDTTLTLSRDVFGPDATDPPFSYAEWGVLANWGDSATSSSEFWRFFIEPRSAVGDAPQGVPQQFAITSVYPNPFNAEAVVQLALPWATHLRVALFDLLGRTTAVLMDAPVAAGVHSLRLDGAGLPSGTYLLRAETSAHGQATRRVFLLK